VKTLYLCLAGSDFSIRIEMTRGIRTVGESPAIREGVEVLTIIIII
jgi:hypothetical protein